jgi:membrane complex biogenesis BtpA family protein
MWTQEMFGVDKPIIALLHLDALPGDPGYCGDMKRVVDHARADLRALQDGGVDGILFANEFSLPYQPVVDVAVVSAMARIIGELKSDLRIPYGVNVVKNPIATIDLAAATDAQFARSCFSGAYMGEYGLYISNSGEAIRHRMHLGITEVKLLFKVNPEADTYLVERDIRKVTSSILFGGFADGLCVSGSAAGKEANDGLLSTVGEIASHYDVPVFCNTGCSHQNIVKKLSISDGACVGTAFKTEERFDGRVDVEKVKSFMALVRTFRANSAK